MAHLKEYLGKMTLKKNKNLNSNIRVLSSGLDVVVRRNKTAIEGYSKAKCHILARSDSALGAATSPSHVAFCDLNDSHSMSLKDSHTVCGRRHTHSTALHRGAKLRAWTERSDVVTIITLSICTLIRYFSWAQRTPSILIHCYCWNWQCLTE